MSPSPAKLEWDTTAQSRLDELETLHADARGTGPGRRWGTEQLNRSLFVILVAQFQTYCRNLHDEAINVHAVEANPAQEHFLRKLLTQGRKLDFQNPQPGVLGSDFTRVGVPLIPALSAREGARSALEKLELLVKYRNAIAHGNEKELDRVMSTGQIRSTFTSYRRFRRTLNGLVSTMDEVVAERLASQLQIQRPW